MSEPDLLTAIEPPAEVPGETSRKENAVRERDAARQISEGFASSQDEDKFDWLGDDSVIIQEQLCLAVYRNRADGVVIRQEARNWDEDDPCIVLRDHDAVRLLIAALQRELKAGR